MTDLRVSDDRVVADDVQVVRRTSPRAMVRRFVTGLAVNAAIMFGGVSVAVGEWRWVLDPTSRRFGILMVGVVGISAITLISDHLFARYHLRRTAGEVQDGMSKSWHSMTAPGWPLRTVGTGLGLSLGIGIAMGIIVSIVDPSILISGSVLRTMAALSGILSLGTVPLSFIFRAAIIHRLRSSAD